MTPDQALELQAELDAVSTRMERLTGSLDGAALVAKPEDSGWSVAENLQHLILTADAMLPLAEAAVVQLEGAARKANGRARLGVVGFLLIKPEFDGDVCV